jgi:hypothetical protein
MPNPALGFGCKGGTMPKSNFLLLILLVLAPLTAWGVEITSIYPEVAYAGTPVTIIGGPFSTEVMVDLDGQLITPKSISPRQLIFLTPQLAVGEYALFLRDGDQTSKATSSLRIELPPPAISSMSPSTLDECSTPEQRRVILTGENIQEGAQLLLNGSVIPFVREDPLSLSFTPLPLKAGSYGVQLVNPDGKHSLPHTLWFDNLPAIESVSEGENFVSYYQIVIRGKNFFHNSLLLVKEFPGGFGDLPPRQRFIPAQGGSQKPTTTGGLIQAENLSYQDCNTLIYNRYPLYGQAMRILLQIGNPDGKQSPAFEVYLP